VSLVSAVTENSREKSLEEKVLQVAEDYGLEIEDELDDVGVRYLGTYVNARTSKAGSKMRIDFDSHNFFQMPEERQRRTILHELIHIKQFNNSLDEWAREEFDVSEKFAEKLDGTIWEGVKSVEGETELILSSFFPEEDSSYPYAESSKESELENLGLDIESEITEEIEDEAEEILDEYRDIESSEKEGSVYMEEGSIGEIDYAVAVMGEDAGPEDVEDYLVDEIGEELDPEEYGASGYGAETIEYKPAAA
jgi:hypothetical protein